VIKLCYCQYVCHHSNFLCPITSAGEPLAFCAGACYSKFMYTCSSSPPSSSTIVLLPTVSGPFSLVVDNPALPALHGKPVTAGGLRWNLAGTTAAYCPVAQVGSDACPPGRTTSFVAGDGRVSMNVMVPGGQQVYLDAQQWTMGYTQAHSAYVPPGSLREGFGAYEGGGFVNLNGGGLGWVACQEGSGGGWTLRGRNETNAAGLAGCTGVNLRVVKESGFGAWQYT